MQLTLWDLFRACKAEIDKGNGNRLVVVADDAEANGYHGLFAGFSTIDTPQEEQMFRAVTSIHETREENDLNKLILLG